MAHVFRLYEGGSDTYNGWFGSQSFPYNSIARDTIKDPNGASAIHEITSIPSPFARIDLVKNAFRIVSESKDPDGNTVFHKMVSDSLDVGELFFNMDKLQDQLQIITWNPNKDIAVLQDSPDKGQVALGDALEKYLQADGATYNFDQMQNIYLLNYVNGPDGLNIIGATSPATLFFSNANNLSYVSKAISFGQDKPFDGAYQPLYKRDNEYIKVWFVLRTIIHGFARLFPEVNDYLDLTFKFIEDSLKAELRAITITTANNYATISTTGNNQVNQVEVLGFPLFKKTLNLKNIKSDFQIKPTTSFEGKLLVLPVVKGNIYTSLRYTTDTWGNENAASYSDERPLVQRTLPNDGTPMPYLTISDLLEDTLIKVPHMPNSRFFNGNREIGKEKLSYLIPVKPLLFDYFSISDLMGKLPDGRHMLDMQLLAGDSVKVTLRIPITGNQQVSYIEYTRIYYNNRGADISRNEGGIIDLSFTGLIMPLIKFQNPADAMYRIAKVSRSEDQFEFEFYKDSLQLSGILPVERKVDEVNKIDVYSLKGLNFDYIKIKYGQYENLLIPIFVPQKNNKIFKYSVDIGTSNSHIEYKEEGTKNSHAFGYDKADVLMSTFFLPTYIEVDDKTYVDEDLEDATPLMERIFLPASMSDKGDYSFPIKTVLASAQGINWQQINLPFELTNVPVTYNKRDDLSNTNYNTNIKWGNSAYLMEAYIDNLLFMIRNKVLQDGGDLSQTTIKWFYPLSMPRKRFTRLQQYWHKAVRHYFPGQSNTLEMSESYAPILYYFNRNATATRLINIDIGGGTTDIAYASGQALQFVTSFRFAANTLFEDSFAPNNPKNGLVDFGQKEIQEIIPKTLSEILRIFEKRSNASTGTADMGSFLFSLSTNSLLRQEKINLEKIDFNRILQDNDAFRIVFIIFYTAIIYHIAQIVKVLNLEVPRHISFAGNGSRVMNIITPDAHLLAQYTKIIFEEVLGKPYKEALDILGLNDSIPAKETTCKGGLCSDNDNGDKDKIVIMRSFGDTLVSSEDTYECLTDDYRNKVISSVNDFFDTLFKLNDKFDFDENFGVEKFAMNLAKNLCNKDLRTFLDKGINLNITEHDQTDKLEETLFFYPIKGVLNILSQEIYNQLNKE